MNSFSNSKIKSESNRKIMPLKNQPSVITKNLERKDSIKKIKPSIADYEVMLELQKQEIERLNMLLRQKDREISMLNSASIKNESSEDKNVNKPSIKEKIPENKQDEDDKSHLESKFKASYSVSKFDLKKESGFYELKIKITDTTDRFISKVEVDEKKSKIFSGKYYK
jgi:hypothetical protein